MSVGIPARSIANVQCGGTTRMSNAIHGLILLAFLTVGSGTIARIPLAALAGVTIWMGARLLDWSTWKRLHKMRRVDAAAFLVTAVAVLLVNAVEAVAIGSALYLIPYLQEKLAKKDAAQPQPVEV
jgi:SulP family sulfate permease